MVFGWAGATNAPQPYQVDSQPMGQLVLIASLSPKLQPNSGPHRQYERCNGRSDCL